MFNFLMIFFSREYEFNRNLKFLEMAEQLRDLDLGE